MNYTRTSRYLPGCDGTRLAVDLYRPDVQGKVPLLLKAGNSPRRRMFEGDEEAVLRFLEARYAVAFVEVRGVGASFGVYDGFFGPRDGKDMECVINALAQEDWCTGKVGTYGGSNHGMIQEITLLEQPEHLYASAPAIAAWISTIRISPTASAPCPLYRAVCWLPRGTARTPPGLTAPL